MPYQTRPYPALHFLPYSARASAALLHQHNRFASLLYPNIDPPPPIAPPCLCCASPCIFSDTFTFTSKNLATQRSRHTDSPLLRSASRYWFGIHFLVQVSTSLSQCQVACFSISSKRWTDWLNMLETISISASAAAIFSAELGCGRPPPKRKDMSAVGFSCDCIRWWWWWF